ncbi:hypothetical protein [Sansalvadorimonas verongulae]|uniref:hypothetical protein n=1 Tax=Sansalvadorimonas verongulae TaxID=2172824 RepID=UPI0012BC1CEB|nr:hypothetical protein [Sansalvadorimonas verongulae]MTI12745.1 hypothetical protein [Sansalvadorimonas verongulae]
MSEKYELVFAGQTTTGAPLEKVKANAAKLFQAGPAQLEKLFSGSPVVLKNNLDKTTAESYQTKLKSAGLLCTLRVMGNKTAPQKPEPQKAAPKAEPQAKAQQKQPATEGSLSLAPTGADVNPHDPAPIPPMPDTSQFSLKEQKGYLFDQDDTPPPPAPDTSHLTMD